MSARVRLAEARARASERVAKGRRELGRRARLRAATLLARAGLGGGEPGAWLFSGASYSDNAAAMFRHVVREHPDVRACWVADAGSPDFAAAAQDGPVLPREALSTWVTALRADVMVLSHGIHDIPTAASPASRALKVRVGHGLTVLKKTKPREGHTDATANAPFGLVPVSSEFERQVKLQWQIAPDRLAITGVPRFDDLLRRSREVPPDDRRILYLPTWREWIPKSEAGVRGSSFLRDVAGFLGHPDLDAVLERHGYVLEVFLHRIVDRAVRPVLERAGRAGRVRLLPASADVQAHLAAARALVTDYSGVTWDTLYLGRPVLFYTFDVDAYEADRGAYVDLRTDLPGPAAHDPGGMVHLLDAALADGLPLSEAARRWSERVFPWRDDRNCARVTAEIRRRLAAR